MFLSANYKNVWTKAKTNTKAEESLNFTSLENPNDSKVQGSIYGPDWLTDQTATSSYLTFNPLYFASFMKITLQIAKLAPVNFQKSLVLIDLSLYSR